MMRSERGALLFLQILTLFVCGCASLNRSDVKISELKCEYHFNPVGVDTAQPRLSWIAQSQERGWLQSAYQMLVASSRENLEQNNGDIWDSGKVTSSRSAQAEYNGRQLKSLEDCWWKIRVWDRKDAPSAWSEPARWTMGLLEQSDWKGKWITIDPNYQWATHKPMPMFRREFVIEKPINRAIVSVCGLGYCELRINGEKVGEGVLEPGWTNYRKTCQYLCYDVTGYLATGKNAVGIILGYSMYNVRGGRYANFGGSFGQTMVIAQLDIEYADGTRGQVVSDQSWRGGRGSIVFTCIYGGEDYDARLEQPGWDKKGFDDSTWQKPMLVDGPGGQLRWASNPPIKVMKTYKPIKVTQPKPGLYVYDLGQNFAGWPKLTVSGPAGTSVRLTGEELLDANGVVTQRRSFGPVYFTYTLKGQGTELWHPQFSYYGFRYMQAEFLKDGLPITDGNKPIISELEGQFVYSSSEPVGSFACSNELFNRIHQIIIPAICSNMQSIFTDCPHREKLGWLEQAYLMAESIMYNFDVAALYGKIAGDMAEAQLDNGCVPTTAPTYANFSGSPPAFFDSPEWGSAYVIALWDTYKRYGDRRIIQAHYEGMKKYVEYLSSRAQDNIVSYGLGDWCDLGPKPSGWVQLTPQGLTGTAIYYYDINILAEAAKLLGKEQDSKMFAALAGQVHDAFNKKFFDQVTKQYGSGSQTSNAMPLVLGLVEPENKSAVLENLVRDVRERGNRLTAGDVGYKFLLLALLQSGRSDVIFDMTNRDDVPGYGYQIKHGATSLIESWDAGRMYSQNHFMLGHIEEWFYKALAGISQEPNSVGFEKIVIRPQIVGNITWVKADYKSIHGKIAVHWKLESNVFKLDVTIPPSTTATVYIPAKNADSVTESGKAAEKTKGVTFLRTEVGAAVYHIGSGNYSFTSKGVKDHCNL